MKIADEQLLEISDILRLISRSFNVWARIKTTVIILIVYSIDFWTLSPFSRKHIHLELFFHYSYNIRKLVFEKMASY